MRLFLFIISILIPFSASAQSVAEDKEWLALLHFQKQIIGVDESTIDSETFFISPVGKYNPDAELTATIRLFEETSDNDKKCLYPARYQWLKKKGLITKPFPSCKELESFYDDIRPSGVTLIFTNAYMNNPASLFGHTLLRIDTARKGTQLLAHGANYGAFTGEENGILFAVLGLTGGYYGGFTVKPYHQIVNEYNNIENRDIWELSLDLTPDETQYLLAHLWEIGQTKTKYYFFTENCSYMLLELLDVIRPDLRLAEQFPVHAIPLDTFKAVSSRTNFIKAINYRPSRQNKIIHQYNQMNKKQQKSFKNIITQQTFNYDDLSNDEKSDVLETAYQYVQYQYVARNLELKDYRKRSFKILTERNKLDKKEITEPQLVGKNPLQSHASSQIGIGFGNRNGEMFEQINLRPAYTSLLDNSYGLLSGAEINFLNIVARHYDDSDKFVLQNLNIIGINSISSRDFMFQPISYNIHLDINREMNPDTQEEGYVLELHGGAGVAYSLTDNIKTFGFVNNHLAYGGFLPHNSWVGIGAEIGIHADYENWRLLTSAEKIFASSHFADKIKYKAGISFDLSRNTALQLHYKFNDNHVHNEEETMLNLQFFY